MVATRSIADVVHPRLTPVHLRAPTEMDDSTQGYAVGSFWIANGIMYRCLLATPGMAIWLPSRTTASINVSPLPNASLSTPPLPGDVLADAATSVVAAYGSIKQKAAYSGAAFDVERESDSAAATIGFIGKKLDVQASASSRLGSENRITKWYDQSGNARHATASGTARPILPPIDMVGPNRGALFDNGVTSNQTLTPDQKLTLPAEVAVNSRSFSILVFAALPHGQKDAPLVELQGTTGISLYFGVENTSNTSGLAVRGDVNNSVSATKSPNRISLEPTAFALTSGASNYKIYQYGEATFTSGAALANVNFTGGLLGSTRFVKINVTDLSTGRSTLGSVLIINRQITDAEVDAIFASFYYHFEGVPQKRGYITFDGDSLSEAAWAVYYQSYPEQLRRMMARPAIIRNVAVSGGTFQTQTSAIAAWANGFDSGAPFNELVLSLGTNNVGAGTTAAATITLLQTYLDTVRTGRNWSRITLGTIMPRGVYNLDPSGVGAQWATYNDWLRANHTSLGCELIDWSAHPPFSDPNVVNDLTYFRESTHLNVDGQACKAAIARTACDYR